MIAKVIKGSRMSGLIVYLAGPGDYNEHTDPRIVAGHDVVMGRDDFGGTLNRETALAVAREVDLPRRVFGTKVEYVDKVAARQLVGAGAPAAAAVAEATSDINVWHCPLSLEAGEGELSDEVWGRIAEEFMDEMGFTAASGHAPARWVAIRHGLSKDGNDHIHIAASAVRDDGTKVSLYRDWPRAMASVNRLEHKYGLNVIRTREADRVDRRAAASTPSRAEVEKASARRAGNRPSASTDPGPTRAQPNQPPRVQLRQIVAETAATTADAESFLREVQQQGVLVYRRLDESGVQTGVAFADPHDTNRTGSPIFYAGGTLSPELTWPKLCAEWKERSTPQAEPPVARERIDAKIATFDDATKTVNAATAAVRGRTEDPAPIAAAAQSMMAGWSQRAETMYPQRDLSVMAWKHAAAARVGGAYGDPSQAGRAATALREASWKMSAWTMLSTSGRAKAPALELALALASLLAELSAWHDDCDRATASRLTRQCAGGFNGYAATYEHADIHGRPPAKIAEATGAPAPATRAATTVAPPQRDYTMAPQPLVPHGPAHGSGQRR